jgi:hypothetical protein
MAVHDPTDIGGTETLSICEICSGRLYITFKSISLGSTIGLVTYSGVMPNCVLVQSSSCWGLDPFDWLVEKQKILIIFRKYMKMKIGKNLHL